MGTLWLMVFLWLDWTRQFPSLEKRQEAVKSLLLLDSIPSSVKNLDCDSWKDGLSLSCSEHAVCYFEINPDDFKIILSGLNFITTAE